MQKSFWKILPMRGGKLIAFGTTSDIVEHAHLTTWEVGGPDLLTLAEQLRSRPGVRQAVAFGNVLHVSGDDEQALAEAVAPFRSGGHTWRRIDSGLEDVFIHLMEEAGVGTAS